MRSDEIITAIRMTGCVDDANADYTDARILIEATDTLHTMFERDVVNSRQGYWLKTYTTPTVASRANYRIPARAVTGGLEKVECADSDGQYRRLVEVSQQQVPEYEGDSSSTAQYPSYYCVIGDQIRLLPAAADANSTLRMTYYVRPSRLVTQQVTGTERGRVTAVNTTARTIAVNAVPFDQELAVPAAITTAVQRIDVIHPSGWFELALVGAAQTLAGTTFTVGGTADMSEIEVGDYVRAAEQTDWPALPVEHHRTLAFATAARIAKARGEYDKSAALFEEVKGDFGRFQDLLLPRIRNSPKVLVPGPYGPIRNSVRAR